LDSEQRQIRISEIHPVVSAASALASLPLALLSLGRKVVGQEFVPGVPAHNETYYTAMHVGKTVIYVPHTRFVEATEDHYEPIYKYFVENPPLMIAALAIPFAAFGALYVRQKWLDCCCRLAENSERVKQMVYDFTS
jgi:hypothetical protein